MKYVNTNSLGLDILSVLATQNCHVQIVQLKVKLKLRVKCFIFFWIMVVINLCAHFYCALLRLLVNIRIIADVCVALAILIHFVIFRCSFIMSLRPGLFYSKRKCDLIPVYPLNNLDSEHESTDDEDVEKSSPKTCSRQKKKILGTGENVDENLSNSSSPSRWPRTGIPDSSTVIPPSSCSDQSSGNVSNLPKLKKRRITNVITQDRFTQKGKQSVQKDLPKPKPFAARNIFSATNNAAPKLSWAPSARASLMLAAAGNKNKENGEIYILCKPCVIILFVT